LRKCIRKCDSKTDAVTKFPTDHRIEIQGAESLPGLQIAIPVQVGPLYLSTVARESDVMRLRSIIVL
jgi:hypothetical protein